MKSQNEDCPVCSARYALVTRRVWPRWVAHLTRSRLCSHPTQRCLVCRNVFRTWV